MAINNKLEEEIEELYKKSFDDIKNKVAELYKKDEKGVDAINGIVEEAEEPHKDNEYHFKKEGDKLICTDHNCNLSGAELEVGTDAKSLLNNLNNIYHKETHDFLSCTKCRPQFDEIVKKSGYTIKENNREIILVKKK